MNPAFQVLPKIFGERRKSIAGEHYTTVLVRMCQDLITRVQGNLPLTPKQLSFLGLIKYDTSVWLSQYTIGLLHRFVQLRSTDEFIARQNGLPRIPRPLPYALKELVRFVQV